MKRVILLFAVLGLLSCNNKAQKIDDRAVLLQTISATEMSALKDAQTIDPKLADSLMNLYDRYTQQYPKDSLCAEFMSKATDIAANTHNCTRALEFLARITDGYASSNYVEWAYFFKGSVYADVCKDKEKAAEAYQFFLDNYPQSKFATAATTLLTMLQLDNEMDLIREFEAKQ
ncbi:MAG: hypothetical protein LBO06_03925 [Bacteroidales bacterium]|jgi:outer membrane protein assembly factor BamD (BamD/ComL family)|nr:hypothetical protein [Bacteroidales bacterium]